MGRILQIVISLSIIATLTACANSDNKWSQDSSQSNESSMNSDSNWKKDAESEDNTRKAKSSYWKEDSYY